MTYFDIYYTFLFKNGRMNKTINIVPIQNKKSRIFFIKKFKI